MQIRSGMSTKEAGKLGGQKRAQKYNHEQLSAQAKRSAQTIEKREPGFHAKIGSKSHRARLQRRISSNEEE